MSIKFDKHLLLYVPPLIYKRLFLHAYVHKEVDTEYTGQWWEMGFKEVGSGKRFNLSLIIISI